MACTFRNQIGDLVLHIHPDQPDGIYLDGGGSYTHNQTVSPENPVTFFIEKNPGFGIPPNTAQTRISMDNRTVTISPPMIREEENIWGSQNFPYMVTVD